MVETDASPAADDAAPPDLSRHVVTAVIVAHDGARWLPYSLDALIGQDRPAQQVVGVDTGSTDETPTLLADALGAGRVVRVARDTGFGEAVARGLAVLDGAGATRPVAPGERPVHWVWLLHDDCAPAPNALRRLLEAADGDPSVGVVGPKVRGWHEGRLLLEAGVTIAGNGRRETGLERREQDQGQHDGQRDVLAVGSAGMLVRRDLWDRLGGFDPRLRLFRDDLDFGWRANAAGHRVRVATDAVVHHAEAATRRRRRAELTKGRPQLVDRKNALYVLLANLPLVVVPFTVLRLLTGTLLRVLGLLLVKAPGEASDELRALLAVLGRPDVLLRARVRRRRTRALPGRDVQPLLAPRGAQLRQMVETLAGLAGGLTSEVFVRRTAPPRTPGSTTESGPAGEDVEELPAAPGTPLRRLLSQPGVVLVLGLTLIALVAARDLLGGGQLMGGALLPAPAGATDLWEHYLSSWHDVGLGSGSPSPPYVGALAVVSTLLLGKATLAVDLLLLGCVPLAGLTAYLATRRLVASRALRLWAAAAYALLPAATGAVAAGRLGTAAVLVLLPLVGLGLVRAFGLDGRPASSQAGWGAGLALGVAAAFVPLSYLLAAPLALAAAATASGLARSARKRAAPWWRLVVVLGVPPVLLLPWTLHAVDNPRLLMVEAGLPGPGLADRQLEPYALLLLHPGGPGMYPLWISAGLLIAALSALLRSTRRRAVAAGWAAALVGLAAGVAVSRLEATSPAAASAAPAAGWPGTATALTGAGLLVAALVGAEQARRRLSARSFGLKQPLAAAVAAVALLSPVLAGAWWVSRGVAGPLERADPALLPAYVAAAAQTDARPRTLVLRSGWQGRIRYAVVGADGPRLGDAETVAPSDEDGRLDAVVARLASGRGGDEAEQLAGYAVGFVLLARPVDAALAAALDTVPGLRRVSAPDGAALWQVSGPVARLRLVAPDGSAATPLPSGPGGRQAVVPATDRRRTLVLAERADSGWRATLDGRPLDGGVGDGWAQAFSVPANLNRPDGGRSEGGGLDGGRLALTHDSDRDRWLLAQGAALLLVVILSLPARRRRDGSGDEGDGPPAVPRHRAPRTAARGVEQAPDRVVDLNRPSAPVGAGTS